MFDGNYRSQRRAVNLSGRQSSSILEQSRRQREQRAVAHQRTAAATRVQASVRQWLVQERIKTGCVSLSMRLRMPRSSMEQRRAWIRQYYDATHTSTQAQSSEQLKQHQQNNNNGSPRIAQAALELLRFFPEDAAVYETVLENCLGKPTTLAQDEVWRRLGWRRGFVELLTTLEHLGQQQQQKYASLLLSSSLRKLWTYAITATPAQEKPTLALLLMSQPGLFESTSNNNTLPTTYYNNDPTTFWNDWFTPLVHALQDPTNPLAVPMARQQSVIVVCVIVKNALDLYQHLQLVDPSLLVCLLEQCFCQNGAVALHMSRVLANTTTSITTNSSSAATREPASNGMDESDNEEDDDPPIGNEARATIQNETRTKQQQQQRTTRLTKQELQTVTSLDRLYQSQVQSWRPEIVTADTTNMLQDLAHTVLGTPECWLQWGLRLLATPSNSATAQTAYVTLLAMLLQTSTGLSASKSTSSPLLTKLAFHQEFMEVLYKYVLTSNSMTAWTVFCDVLAHRLIAIKDDQFLLYHASPHAVIVAETVIAHLREYLYDMYWTKPVRATDIKIPFGRSLLLSEEERTEAIRARLFVSGTKLYTSLYERWCRLVRQTPFCSESAWIFPHMSTATNESAVAVDARSNDSEAMQIDPESDDDDEYDNDQQMLLSAVDAENEALANVFSDPKMARILTSIPWVLPFDRRVRLFDALLTSDKAKTQDEASDMRAAMLQMMRGEEGNPPGRELIDIHRDNLYQDSMRQLNKLNVRLKKKVQVTFTNQHGALEAGIDGGGVFKEFIDDLIKDAFLSDNSTAPYHLFNITPLQTLTVNSDLPQNEEMQSHYEFLGRVLGKAVYESILVEPQFSLPFLNQLLGKSNTLEDLKNFDPEYYTNLTKLLTLSAADLNSMGLTFELTSGTGNATRTIELIAGGRSISVTAQNVIKYVHLVANQRLNVETALPTKAFLRGFRDLIPASWVRLFSAYELQKLISGDDSVRGIDVPSLKASMQYAAGYHFSQPIIQAFWEIIEEFNAQEQQKFLKFMTSCSRQPLLGFASMEPAPCVQQIRLADEIFKGDPDRQAPLPTSSTCMNLLKLPNYRNKELMRKKLRAAIESGAGFELT
jgi:ubiquitin-protein ligase E3 C